eukprot:1293431-Pyramimonas_sp.AAC.2
MLWLRGVQGGSDDEIGRLQMKRVALCPLGFILVPTKTAHGSGNDVRYKLSMSGGSQYDLVGLFFLPTQTISEVRLLHEQQHNDDKHAWLTVVQ